MATYVELNELRSSAAAVRNRVATAVAVKAALIDSASPSTAQLTWAKGALMNAPAVAEPIFLYLLAKNNGMTVAQLTSDTAISDSAIQTAVSAAVDKLIAGGV